MTWNFLWSYWTLGKTCFVEWNRTRYATYEKKRSGFIIFFCEGHVLYCWWTILVLVLPWREFCWANFLIFFFKFYKKFHLAFLPAVLLLWLSLSQCKFCCWIMLENPKKKKNWLSWSVWMRLMYFSTNLMDFMLVTAETLWDYRVCSLRFILKLLSEFCPCG